MRFAIVVLLTLLCSYVFAANANVWAQVTTIYFTGEPTPTNNTVYMQPIVTITANAVGPFPIWYEFYEKRYTNPWVLVQNSSNNSYTAIHQENPYYYFVRACDYTQCVNTSIYKFIVNLDSTNPNRIIINQPFQDQVIVGNNVIYNVNINDFSPIICYYEVYNKRTGVTISNTTFTCQSTAIINTTLVYISEYRTTFGVIDSVNNHFRKSVDFSLLDPVQGQSPSPQIEEEEEEKEEEKEKEEEEELQNVTTVIRGGVFGGGGLGTPETEAIKKTIEEAVENTGQFIVGTFPEGEKLLIALSTFVGGVVRILKAFFLGFPLWVFLCLLFGGIGGYDAYMDKLKTGNTLMIASAIMMFGLFGIIGI